MIDYRYTARTTTGERVEGSFRAPDPQAVIAGLRERTLFVTSIERRRAWTTNIRLPRIAGSGGNLRGRTAFFRALATLTRAGVPLRRALIVGIERSGDERFKNALRTVSTEIERGESLSSSLARFPKIFPPLITSMIAAGEAGGIFDIVLDRIATFLERDAALRKGVLAALAYPALVLTASFVLVIFLMIRIVPTFNGLFSSFHVELPPLTQALFTIGAVLANPWFWVTSALSTASVVTAISLAQRTQDGRLAIDRARLRIPILGAFMRKVIHARVARMLGTLVHSGVELTRAIDIVVPVAGSAVFGAALTRIGRAVREGDPLSPPLGSSRLFDPMLVALVGVGEETGMLDSMLDKAAEYFDDDVAAAIATLNAVIEPALLVVLGGIVGFIVIATFLPIYSLIGSVSK